MGPEMKSTGEVMGIDTDFSNAYAKASIAAGLALPTSGKIFITMIDKFKAEVVPVAKKLVVSPPAFIITEVPSHPESAYLICNTDPSVFYNGPRYTREGSLYKFQKQHSPRSRTAYVEISVKRVTAGK